MSVYICTKMVFRSSLNKKEVLVKLQDFILELKKDSGIKNDFGQDWLGHLAYNLCKKKGLSDYESEKEVVTSLDYAGCRGTLESLELDVSDENVSSLNVYTETKNYSASTIFKEILSLSEIKDVEFFWQDFYEDGEIVTNDSNQIVFKGSYYIDSDCDADIEEFNFESDVYSKEDSKKIFINILTSKYAYEDDLLTQEEAEKLTTEELFNLVDSAEFYDENDDEIYLVVKEVTYE